MTRESEHSEADQGAWSHLTGSGKNLRARMVDVGGKDPSRRSATARARVQFPPGMVGRLREGAGPKGPVEEVARVAGILAAKRTGELIPMCHPLALDQVDVTFEAIEKDGQECLEITCQVLCSGKTGVEMEAMTGASVAALTVYDMAKGLDKGIVVQDVRLLEKTGGKSGDWRAES